MRPIAILVLMAAGQAAAAEPVIKFSGDARFGVTFDDAATDRTDPYGLMRFDTEASTRLDNGLEIGAQMRIEGENGRPAAMSAPRFYITTGRTQPLPRR